MERGRYALLRQKQVVGIYDTVSDAQMTGERSFSDKLFAVQKIDDQPIELGVFSHAVYMGQT